MRARRYTERVTLYDVQTRVDDFGAIKRDVPVLIGERWAKVVELGTNRKMYYFNTTEIESFEIELRYSNAIRPKQIRWNGTTLQVDGVENVDNNNRVMKIIATRR